MSAAALDEAEVMRTEALHALGVLDTSREERYDQVVRLARTVFDVPMAAVNLVDTDRQWTKAEVGLDGLQRTPLVESMCRYTIREPGTMVVPDAAADQRFHDNRFVRRAPFVRFYAGHPLRAPGGERVGSLCLLDTRPRQLSAREHKILQQMAGWVEKELTLHRDLDRAGRIQQLLMPRTAPALPGYQLAGQCTPSWQIGGDFYDWNVMEGQLQLHVVDVMGKGVPAALIAASVRAVLRAAARFDDLQQAVTWATSALGQQLEDTGTFVTSFCARLDPATGAVDYVDAGHGLAVVLDGAGGHRRLEPSGLPLGALPGSTWEAHRTVLAPGQTLLVVSDGFLDFFDDLDTALARAVEVNLRSAGACDLVEAFTACARAHDHRDDATVVALRRNTA